MKMFRKIKISNGRNHLKIFSILNILYTHTEAQTLRVYLDLVKGGQDTSSGVRFHEEC